MSARNGEASIGAEVLWVWEVNVGVSDGVDHGRIGGSNGEHSQTNYLMLSSHRSMTIASTNNPDPERSGVGGESGVDSVMPVVKGFVDNRARVGAQSIKAGWDAANPVWPPIKL